MPAESPNSRSLSFDVEVNEPLNSDVVEPMQSGSRPECLTIDGVPETRIPVLERICSRGVTVEALLDLVCFLLDPERALNEIKGMRDSFRDFAKIPQEGPMPSMDWFDPKTSTTRDVANKAVIPLSQYVKTACQPILMKGQSLYPKAIITHSWETVFTDTVAACVADALDNDVYFHIVPQLRTYDRVRELVDELKEASAAANTYWLCLVCINQHMIDWTLHVVDYSDPNCEIGHVDEMLRFLASKQPDFYQVVAFDRRGTILSRAWVLAEINDIQQASLNVRVKLHVPVNVVGSRVHIKINWLDVRKSNATFAGDKVRILDAIPDTRLCNQDVRAVLRSSVQGQGANDRDGFLLFFGLATLAIHVVCVVAFHVYSYRLCEFIACALAVFTIVISRWLGRWLRTLGIYGVTEYLLDHSNSALATERLSELRSYGCGREWTMAHARQTGEEQQHLDKALISLLSSAAFFATTQISFGVLLLVRGHTLVGATVVVGVGCICSVALFGLRIWVKDSGVFPCGKCLAKVAQIIFF